MRSVSFIIPAKIAHRSLNSLITILLLITGLVSAMPTWAVEILNPSDCAGTFNPNLSCTSNDIKINDVSQMTVAEGGQQPIATCNEGDTGLVDIKLTTQLNATGRYDVLTWFGTQGNDPRDATTGNCYVTSLPNDPASAFILDLEAGADACLDVNSSPNPVTQYMKQVPYTCQDLKSLDANGDVVNVPDGEADVFALVTWFQNNTLNCGTGAGQSMEPGVNPKCDVSLLLGLNIQIITNPSIQIVKTPATQSVSPGGQADFTLTVNNIGDVDLDTVNVTDAMCDSAPVYQSGDTGSDNVLGQGESWVYTCSTTNVQAGFTNQGDVTALETGTANQVSDSDTAAVSLNAPSIEIVKTPATQTVNPGGTASFTLTVNNTGNVDLDTVVVTDNDCDSSPVYQSGDTGSDNVLGTGESWVYTCSTANVQSGFTNNTGVTAIPVEGGDQVSGNDSADVTTTSPAVQIVKTPDQSVAPGGTASFTLTVTNPGDVDLNNVVVTDAMCDANPMLQSGDIGVDGVLGTSETWIYTCSTANVQSAFTNSGSVTADPVGGGDSVNDSDTANVTMAAPAVQIVKGPDQNVTSGGTANFTLTVSNPGDVDLDNVVVTDALCDASPAYQSGDSGADGVLGMGETWYYTCSTANVQAGFTNSANVTADPVGGGNSVNDSDTANVTVTEAPPEVPIPASGLWALLLLTLTVMATGLYFRRRRS